MFLVQLGTTRNYIAVGEKLLGFVLVCELACTELQEKKFQLDTKTDIYWIPHGLSKRQSLSMKTVLSRTKSTRTIILSLLMKSLLGSNLSQ